MRLPTTIILLAIWSSILPAADYPRLKVLYGGRLHYPGKFMAEAGIHFRVSDTAAVADFSRSHGPFASAGLGVAGASACIGYAVLAVPWSRRESYWFMPPFAYGAAGLSYLRTYGDPIDVAANQDFIGVSLKGSLLWTSLELGAYTNRDDTAADDFLLVAGVGMAF